MTLRRRLSLLVGVALTPPLLLTLHTIVRSQIVLEEQARDDALAAARQVSDKLALILEGSRQLAAVISKHPASGDDEAAACGSYLKSVIADIPMYDNAAIINTDGHLECSAAPVSKALASVVRNPTSTDQVAIAFRKPALPDQLVDARPESHEATAPLIAVFRPLSAPNASPRSVAVSLDPNRLAQELDLENRPWKSRDRVLLLDGQGSLVLAIAREGVQEGKILAKGIAAALASQRAGVAVVRDWNGRPEIVGFASVSNAPLPLFTAVAIDRQVAVAEARSANVRSLLFAAIAAMFAIGCTWLATHLLINRPIRAIVETARRRGAGDMEAHFPRLSISSEFDQLSTALSSMSGRINELLEQKTLLLRELQHRVMNSLMLLSSVLDIQRRQVTDATARDHLARARDRVLAIGTIYRHLYQADTPNEVEFGEFLKTLCQESQNAYAGIHKPTITVEADALEIPGARAIALAIVTHELITNALKHAYPEGRPGPLAVKLKRRDDGGIDLSVSDQGRGLPEDFQIEQSASLGMKVVAATAAQLGGTIEIHRLEPGTEFVVQLPGGVLARPG